MQSPEKPPACRRSRPMAKPDEEIEKLLLDQYWRLNNLYKIKDSQGNSIQFKFNWAQLHFYKNMHYFNVILKARQLGFSTFVLIFMLDAALFNDNQDYGVIAQGLTEASDLFNNKIKFAYDNLPPDIKAARTCVSDSARMMKWNNGSSIVVGTSLRGGTFQKLLVSEYGKISARYPEKAKEIKTGAFNTVHKGGQLFVESTAEGMQGEFFELVKLSRKLEDEERELSTLDPKFHFYPWFQHPSYTLDAIDQRFVTMTKEHADYFDSLPVELTAGQKAWYIKKATLMGEDMKREFPTTPDEAFSASLDGAYYSKQMQTVRKNGQICRILHDPKFPVYTFWDLGKSKSDYMSIWFFQNVGREYRFIRYYEASGLGFDHYWREMQTYGYTYGAHYFPHDGVNNQHTPQGLFTQKEIAEKIGIQPVTIIKRTSSVQADIQVCRNVIPLCHFDDVNAAAGITCLDNYRKQWDDNLAVWKDEPRHDEFSHGADSFRSFAVGWEPRKDDYADIDDDDDRDYDITDKTRSSLSGY